MNNSPSNAQDILMELKNITALKNMEAYIVGGYVRDLLTGRQAKDIDLLFPENKILDVVKKIAAYFGATFYKMDVDRGFYRILIHGDEGQIFTVDAVPLSGSIEENLAMRDFTINSLAIPLANFDNLSDVIDFNGGVQDIKSKIIRYTRKDVFKKDPIRLLRCIRISSQIGFDIDDKTRDLIAKDANYLSKVSPERSRDELLHILALDSCKENIWKLDKFGLLIILFPELENTRGVEQPEQHYWDVLEHSIETVGIFENIVDTKKRTQSELLVKIPWLTELDEYFATEVVPGRSRSLLTKIACLLHDIAKPQTKKVHDDGKIRFLGHPDQGADMTSKMLKNLKFSNKEINFIKLVIQQHLRPMQLSNDLSLPSSKSFFRFKRDLGNALFSTLYLSIADYLAAKGPKLRTDQWDRRVEYCQWVLSGINSQSVKSVLETPMIDGNMLMKELNLNPGPRVGFLLKNIQEAIAAGDVRNKDNAINYARDLLSARNDETVTDQDENIYFKGGSIQ